MSILIPYNQKQNNMTKIIQAMLAMMLVATAMSAPCVDQRNLVQTGVVTITNSNQANSRQICAVAQLNYSSSAFGVAVPQAALSLAQFSYNSANGLDYSVHGVATNAQLNIVLSIVSDNRWSSVQVSYIVESRQDVWSGTFIGDISLAFSGCVNTGTNGFLQSLVSTTVTGVTGNPANLLIVTFIAGIRAPARFSITLGNPTISANGVLQIPVTNATTSIDLIYVGYVIFTTTNSPLTFNYYQIGLGSSKGSLQWIGVDHYSNANAVLFGLDIVTNSLICTGSNCPSSCITPAECQNINGVSNGNQCVACVAPQTLVNGQCTCPENMVLINGACGCGQGSINVGGTCINQCGINQVWNGSACICSQGYATYTGGACQQCPATATSSSDGTTCVCGFNSIFDTFTVTCLANNCPSNSQATVSRGVVQCQCNAGSFLDSTGTTCISQPTCPSGSSWNSQSNQCLCFGQNTFLINGACTSCPANSNYNGNNCVCNFGFTLNGNTCIQVPQCPQGSSFSQQSNQCVCNNPNSFMINGICSTCPPNSNYNGNSCVCNSGFTLIGSACTLIPQCPQGASFNQQTNQCICINPNSFIINGACGSCPQRSTFNGNSCVCDKGFYTSGSSCIAIPKCPQGASFNQQSTQCVCNNPNFIIIKNVCVSSFQNNCPANSNYVQTSNTCVCSNNNEIWNSKSNACNCIQGTSINGAGQCTSASVVTCPQNSVWNSNTLKCVCSINGQFLIQNVCQSCPANSGWNGTTCVCRTNYFFIGGVCRTCDPNTNYSPAQQDCVCNIGYYGNRDLCSKCESTCGKCSGPNANQCLTCSDVTYKLENNTCFRPAPCPSGLYTDGSYCYPCSSYCATCSSLNVCSGCITGFNLTTTVISNPTTTVISCSEVCGDGRRFILPCDDGNTRNGDGCSSTCQVETGWTCSAGSATSKSNCIQSITMRSIITPKGKVNTFGQVQMGVTISNLPAGLIVNSCATCSDILLVKVIQSDVIPTVTVQYQPASQYKFIIVFDFNGLISIPPFTITLQINPTYASSFQAIDMSQLIQVDIDPATLSKPNDNNGELSLGALLAPTSSSSLFN